MITAKKHLKRFAFGLILALTALAAQAGDITTIYGASLSQLESLSQQGYGQAQFDLALLYHSGSGTQHSEDKAVKLYKAAADNGSLMAQQFLAVAYQEGWFGLPQDLKQAQYWSEQIEYSKGVRYY